MSTEPKSKPKTPISDEIATAKMTKLVTEYDSAWSGERVWFNDFMQQYNLGPIPLTLTDDASVEDQNTSPGFNKSR